LWKSKYSVLYSVNKYQQRVAEVEELTSQVPIGDDDEIVDLEETVVVDVELLNLGIASFIGLIKGEFII
jgi:hypothetical protein